MEDPFPAQVARRWHAGGTGLPGTMGVSIFSVSEIFQQKNISDGSGEGTFSLFGRQQCSGLEEAGVLLLERLRGAVSVLPLNRRAHTCRRDAVVP